MMIVTMPSIIFESKKPNTVAGNRSDKGVFHLILDGGGGVHMILGEYVRAKGQPLRSLWYVYDWEI